MLRKCHAAMAPVIRKAGNKEGGAGFMLTSRLAEIG